MLQWKVCKIILVWDVNYAARKTGGMCNGRIRSFRLKQVLVNHKICKESVANPGFAKMNINVMRIWWHDNFCSFKVVNFCVQTIHSSTETRALWAKCESETNTTFTPEGFLLFTHYFLPMRWTGDHGDLPASQYPSSAAGCSSLCCRMAKPALLCGFACSGPGAGCPTKWEEQSRVSARFSFFMQYEPSFIPLIWQWLQKFLFCHQDWLFHIRWLVSFAYPTSLHVSTVFLFV